MEIEKVIEYHNDMVSLRNLLIVNRIDFECIVALKRSGWILGSYLSNYFDIPVFSESEIKSIPINKYKNILIVDDKVCTGHSFIKCRNKLLKHNINFNINNAVLYIEGNKISASISIHQYVKKLNQSKKMYYETY